MGLCFSCGAQIPFDGRSLGIFNFNNAHLFAVEFLLEFLQLYGRNGLAETSWWVTQVEIQVGLLNRPEQEVHATCREWTKFAGQVCQVAAEWIGLIEIPSAVFKRCESPVAVAADGIVLSVRSHELKKLKSPWL